jgi:hypothetical protein
MKPDGTSEKFQKVKMGRVGAFVKFQKKAFHLGLALNKLNEVHEQIRNVSESFWATPGWAASAKIPEIICAMSEALRRGL